MIEPLVSSQWFVKTEGMGAKALAAVETKEIQILPERYVRLYVRVPMHVCVESVLDE